MSSLMEFKADDVKEVCEGILESVTIQRAIEIKRIQKSLMNRKWFPVKDEACARVKATKIHFKHLFDLSPFYLCEDCNINRRAEDRVKHIISLCDMSQTGVVLLDSKDAKMVTRSSKETS